MRQRPGLVALASHALGRRSPRYRTQLTRLLKRAGHEVTWAGSIDEARAIDRRDRE